MDYMINTLVFGDWKIIKEIGEGSYGTVYEIQKTDYGVTTHSALKVIHIPRSNADIKAALNEGMDEQSVTSYFQGFVTEIVQEISVMASLKSHPNIVAYEDHCVLEHNGDIGWDILIRMELLTPLQDYIFTHNLNENNILHLAQDICSALAFCQKKGLIHRDIKPENIFTNEAGQFKLGDFGVARTIEKTTGGLSKKGTESYMAPEVYLSKPYGSAVDIYSLGLVLYKFMNDNRLPFLPSAPKPITFADRENALSRRMSGEILPPPANANKEFADIILKACAYQPEERYRTAADMLEELKKIATITSLPKSESSRNAQVSLSGFKNTETDNTVDLWNTAPAALNEKNDTQPETETWKIIKTIGKGSYGTVYEIQTTNSMDVAHSALKIIQFSDQDSNIHIAMTEESIKSYFIGFAKYIIPKVKNHPNIVKYEDLILGSSKEADLELFFRMELLTPVFTYINPNNLNENTILQMAKDICNALNFCHKKDLIHRNIKPENIFVNESGQFKLGDIGIAQAAEKTLGLSPNKQTEKYMAPEAYSDKTYTPEADIYAFGLVLYEFMNDNRLPFLPPAPNPITFADRENALSRRMKGELLPPPANASKEFADIILKACAYRPEERYHTAADMLEDIKELKTEPAIPVQSPALSEEESTKLTKIEADSSNSQTQKTASPKKKVFPLIAAIAVVIIVAAYGGKYVMQLRQKQQIQESIDESIEARESFFNTSENLDSTQAIEQYEIAITSYPEDERSYIGLSEAYIKNNDYEKAYSTLQQGLKACPDSTEIEEKIDTTKNTMDYLSKVDEIAMLMDSGNYEQAIQACKEAIALNPTKDGIYKNIIQCYLIQNKADEALAFLESNESSLRNETLKKDLIFSCHCQNMYTLLSKGNAPELAHYINDNFETIENYISADTFYYLYENGSYIHTNNINQISFPINALRIHNSNYKVPSPLSGEDAMEFDIYLGRFDTSNEFSRFSGTGQGYLFDYYENGDYICTDGEWSYDSDTNTAGFMGEDQTGNIFN